MVNVLNRRAFLTGIGSAVVARPAFGTVAGTALSKPIPSTGEAIPLVGLGSWLTFNVGADSAARDSCAAVMGAFFNAGGRLIDSSPMYGSSQEVIGYGVKRTGNQARLFSATKVWVSGGRNGPPQIEQSRRLWGVAKFDLLQVHSLLSWREHLPTLFAMKAAGHLRYVGVTTSHERGHGELEEVMRAHPLDFIQVTYNVTHRDVERRILPLAAERRMAVIVNRPFEGGELIYDLRRKALPSFAGEIGCASWAQFLLKFIVSHPAVTCAIPATTRVDHVEENMARRARPCPTPRCARVCVPP
ncbi:MAG: aldo/keto reductase [Alphaproteobacteria bacterium]